MSGTATPDYGTDFSAAGAAYNVDPKLLRSVFNVESGGNWNTPNSKAGAIGGMQIMPATAQSLGIDPRDPVQSIWGAAKLLDQNLRQYGTPERALMAYNGGNESRWNNPETQAYPGKVLAAYRGLAVPAQATGAQQPYQIAAANTGTMSDAAPSPMAPPSAAPAGNGQGSDDISAMTWQQFRAAVTRGAPPSTPAGSNAPAAAPAAPPAAAPQMPTITVHPSAGAAPGAAPPAGNDPDDISSMTWQQFRAAVTRGAAPTPQGTQAPTSTPAPAPAAAPVTPQTFQAPDYGGEAPLPVVTGAAPVQATTLANAAAGFKRGVEDVGDTGARAVDAASDWVNSRVPWLGALDQRAQNAGLIPSSSANVGALDRDRAAYVAQYGNSVPAAVGRAAGQIVATAPVLGPVGRAADAVASAIPNAALRFAGGVAGNALTGAAGAGLTSGASDQPLTSQLAGGAVAGGVMGAAGRAIGGAMGIPARAASGMDPARAQLAQTAVQKYGIPLRADQISAAPFTQKVGQYLEQTPLSGVTPGPQQTAFTRAVSRTFGENAPTLTPQVLQNARQRIGAAMGQVENNNPVHFDDQFVNDTARIENDAHTTLTPDEARVVTRLLTNTMARVQAGDTITGETYGNLIHAGSALDKATQNANRNIANAAGEIKDALRDALQRSVSPDDAAAYSNARLQYKNLMTVAPLVSKGVPGEVSPARLQQAVNTAFGNRPFGGGGDLGELADIGQQFLKEPKDSGTALGNRVAHLLTAPGMIGGAIDGAYHLANNPLSTAALGSGALGTVALTRGIGAAMNNPAFRDYIIQQGLAPRAPGVIANALTRNTLIAPASLAARNALAYSGTQ